jgi:quercetin dioxygenase-like cupin family protein
MGSEPMTVIRQADLRYIETPGGNFGAAVATPSRGAVDVSIIRQRQTPGGANPSHTHNREEVMLILSGEVTVVLDAGPVTLGTGDSLIIPAGTAHQIENRSAEDAEWLLLAPASVEFIKSTGEKGTPPWAM